MRDRPPQTMLESNSIDLTSYANGLGNAKQIGRPAGSVDCVVQVSNQSPTAGFETIATVVLKARQDKQKFSVSKTIPARWVKLTIISNHSS
ncbi:MAG: hypothetical protein ABIZ09_13040 [Rhodoferax sp.]